MKELTIYSSLAEIQFVLENEVRQIVNERSIKDLSAEELKSITDIYANVNQVLRDKLELKNMELERKMNRNNIYSY